MNPSYLLVAPIGTVGSAQEGLTYHADEPIPVGSLVKIPLARRQLLGIVMKPTTKPDFATRAVLETITPELVPPHLVELAAWLSRYYFCDLGRVWQTMLPAGLTRRRRATSQPARGFKLAPMQAALTPAQAAAITTITASRGKYLLYGVTGSGKTQVYLEVARAAMQAGRSSLILVPEIALTPQIIAQFEAIFGQRVIANHSGLTESQRHQAWLRAHSSQEPLVVVGPRSSLFLPVPELGLIVVDECHEGSYKQDQSPRYHAVATAAKLSDLTDTTLVLGSATPGLNEVYLTQQQRLKLIQLPERIGGSAPPTVEIIDLRDKALANRSPLLSRPLLEAMADTYSRGRQSLLFLNRRGSASALLCTNCNWVDLCPNCRLPLTFHADQVKLVCHHCNHRHTPPALCPNCQTAGLRYIGSGTKRLESEVSRLFPELRLQRLDRDSAAKTNLDQLYQQLHAGEIDVIIGTQMIAKGLDLPKLDTVGIINADTTLYLPDYTASERCYQLVSQVTGRSGRRGQAARVFVQTYSPEHPAITAAAAHDFWSFAAQELAARRLLAYPPYRYLLKLTCSAKTAATAERQAAELRQKLISQPQLEVVGPAPAFREFSGGKYHWQLIAKAKSRSQLLAAATLAPSGTGVDLDPANLL